MATPYVTDETGGECGRRGAASPRALGAGVRTWKGVCAPPIPGPLLLPRPPDRLPHSFSPMGCHLRPLLVSCLGVSASGHPNPGVLQCKSLLQDPHGPLAFLQQLEIPCLFWFLQAWELLYSQFPPIPAFLLFPSPIFQLYLPSALPPAPF